MSWFLIYLFVIADQLRDALSGYGGVGFIFLLVSFVTIFIHLVVGDEVSEAYRKTSRKICYFIGIVFISMATLHTLVPTQKNLAILIAGGATYEAVTSESGKRIGGKLIGLLEQKIDESLQSDAESQSVTPSVKDIEIKGEKI